MNWLQNLAKVSGIYNDLASKHLPGGIEQIVKANEKAARIRVVDTRKISQKTEASK